MKFKIKYTKLGNQFFFISNLTEWHFSCEKEYNKIWLKETGPLSEKEKTKLKQFAKILRKYGFKKKKDEVTWLGVPFIVSREKDVWKNVKKWVDKKEYSQIKETFEIFEERFKKIWSREFLKLEKFEKLLIQKVFSKKVEMALLDLARFYNKKLPLNKTINIYLFVSPKESSGSGGGAILEEKGITLEVRDSKDIKEYIQVIIHEIAHAFLAKDSTKKIQKITKEYKFPQNRFIKQRSESGLIQELILCSLFPEGYLGEKYFDTPIPKPKKVKTKESHQVWKSLVESVTVHLYPLAQRYIETKRSLDKNYIVAIIKLTQRFFKKT